jgi:hypothetical protein
MDVPVHWSESRGHADYAGDEGKPDQDGQPRLERGKQEERTKSIRQERMALIGLETGTGRHLLSVSVKARRSAPASLAKQSGMLSAARARRRVPSSLVSLKA